MPDSGALAPLARRGVFEAYRREGAREWIEAAGGSMRPLIRPGRWMLVRFGGEPASVGDIVVFPLRGSLVAHRVVGTRRIDHTQMLLTKGDAAAHRDPAVAPEGVLGIVLGIGRRRGGPAVTAGCTGRSARTIARISLWTYRAGVRTRRLARLLPDPLRRPAIAAATALAGSAGRAGVAPWAALAAAQSRAAERR